MRAPNIRPQLLAEATTPFAANRAALQWLLPCMVLLAAPAAFAQQVGHYQGTNGEGYQVDVYVSTSGDGLAVTGMDDSGTVYCKGTAAGVWGVDIGTTAPISDGAASIDLLDVNLYYSTAIQFSGNTKVKGTIQFAVPEYVTTAQPPKTACSGITKKQKFTATYVGTETRAPGPVAARAWPLSTSR
jgi:hypothetical protein